MKKIKIKNYLIIFLAIITSFFVIQTQHIYSQNNSKNKEKKIDNILLIGEDEEGNTGGSRSDSMIIMTINRTDKRIKLTSLTRDTFVNIPGRGAEKLNHAYAYGGPKLLLKTIKENFGIDIKDYAIVDFKSFIEIVNILDGVNVNVNKNEIEHFNKIIDACYGLDNENKGNIEYITSEGEHKLNGYQALAYARIRKIDTIYHRDNRQRKILSNIAYKLSNTSIQNYPSIVKCLVKHVRVNISIDKIMKLALIGRDFAKYEVKQMEFPLQGYRQESILEENGMFVIKWDKKENLKELKKFIYQ